jgi:ribonuclease D
MASGHRFTARAERVAAWREETARRQNLARTFVIPDKALLQIAFLKPTDATDFQQIEGLHPRTIAKYRTAILEAVSLSGESDDPIEQTLPLTKPQSKRLNDMREMVQQEARALQLDPALLASRKQLG